MIRRDKLVTLAESITVKTVAVWAVVLTAGASAQATDWTQWGGPDRNFTCRPSATLATTWPEDGPRKLWTREIGDGYSSILVENGRLYTMCRRAGKDAVLAIDARTGKTIWETQYDAPMKAGMQLEFGEGPFSTPLLVGDSLYTVSATLLLHRLDKKSGRIIWVQDLAEKFNVTRFGRGYGASPIAYKDTVIMIVGGPGQGVVAFKQDTGEVAWQAQDSQVGYPSPILINVDGRDMLVIATGANRAGLNPDNGEQLWKLSVDRQSAAIMSTPLWIGNDTLFFTAAYGGGSRAVKIIPKKDASEEDGKYEAKELWHYRKMQVQHCNAVRIGDYVYGSTGDFGPAFMIGINLEDAKPAWRARGFGKANLLLADGKLIILDEDGRLAIATASPAGLEVHAQVELLDNGAGKSWTVPTLVGTNLYVRNRKTIMALDLSG